MQTKWICTYKSWNSCVFCLFFSSSCSKICVVLPSDLFNSYNLKKKGSTFFVRNIDYVETINNIPTFKASSSTGCFLLAKNDLNVDVFTKSELDIANHINVERYTDEFSFRMKTTLIREKNLYSLFEFCIAPIERINVESYVEV